MAPASAGVVWCIFGVLSCFAWLPGTAWGSVLYSILGRWFLPHFSLAFAAGWAAGMTDRMSRCEAQEGVIRATASLTGMATVFVACVASCAVMPGVESTLWMTGVIYTALTLLPAALFASIGARWATTCVRWQWSAVLPALAALIWPVGYVAGRVLQKPLIPQAAPVAHVKPSPPKPRYVQPEGFDAAHAWKRVVMHEDVIPNVVGQSPLVLSHDERRLAFVVRENGKHFLVLRHLYEPNADESFALDAAIAALAWSPDDSRIIYLSAKDGAFWVCEIAQGKTTPLPIPKLDANQRHSLVWCQDENVLDYRQRGDPAVLSLDSLRMTAASDHEEWKALSVDQRTQLSQKASPPDLLRNDTVKFAFVGGTEDGSSALVLNDDESLYTRFIARADSRIDAAFPNRDGTMFFSIEKERLRILQLGLRESPALRFIAESHEAFPADERVNSLLTRRSIRAAVVAPVINPLNGKTVAGDSSHIKGYARFIAASGTSCTVWIEQERERIREGDVLIALSAIQDGDEYSVSPDWWAVLKRVDTDQSIPRRADVPMLLLSPMRVLRPLPYPAPPPPKVSATPVPPPAPKPAPTAVMPPKVQASATEEEKVRAFLVGHHEKLTKRDLDEVVSTYGAVATINGRDMTREQIRARQRAIFATASLITERVDGPIEVKRGQNNRFSASYTIVFEAIIPDADDERGEAFMDVDVLLTGSGPKIVTKKMRVFRHEKTKNR